MRKWFRMWLYHEGFYQLSKIRDKLSMWVVWHLPRGFVMWCAIRVIAHATTGQYSNQLVPELKAMDAIDRWKVS